MNAAIANSTIPSPSGAKLMVKKDFTTPDIITRVNDCFKLFNKQVAELAPSFAGSTTEETCYNVWKFIKNNIRYQVDANGNQYVQTPSALWHSKVGDCKSFAVFAASILHNLGIDGVIRFVSYSAKDDIPKHVYVVVPGGAETIIVDPTPLPNGKVYWNAEYNPKHIYDYSMSELAIISGIGSPAGGTRRRKVYVRRPAVRGMYYIGCGGDGETDVCNAHDPEAPVKGTKGNTATLEQQVSHDSGIKPKKASVSPWLVLGLGLAAIKLFR